MLKAPESENPHVSKALTLKADSLYNMGDFEHALLNYHRALKTANSRVSLPSYPPNLLVSI